MAFLERVKDDFISRYGGGKAAAASANGLNKEFGFTIKSILLLVMQSWYFPFLVAGDMGSLNLFFYCRSKLKEHMQYCVDHPEEISKLAKVKAQVSEVKGVMMENIEKVCDDGYIKNSLVHLV